MGQDFLAKAVPDFGKANGYETICRETWRSFRYTLEFWEKIEDDVYTENKVAIMLEENGDLASLVTYGNSVFTDEQEFKAPPISEGEAISIAYTAIKKKYESLVGYIETHVVDARLELRETGTEWQVEITGIETIDFL